MATLLSERLKYLRSHYGLTVREFAERAGITHSMVSDFENDKKIPGRKVVAKIAKAFHLTESDLLDWAPPIASAALKADFAEKLKLAAQLETVRSIDLLSRLIDVFLHEEQVNRKLDALEKVREDFRVKK